MTNLAYMAGGLVLAGLGLVIVASMARWELRRNSEGFPLSRQAVRVEDRR